MAAPRWEKLNSTEYRCIVCSEVFPSGQACKCLAVGGSSTDPGMPQSPSQPTPPRAAEADELPTADAIRYRLVANAMRLHTISLRVSRGVVNPNLGTAAAKIEAEAGKAWARAYDALRDREESEIVARYEKIKRDLDKASGEGRRSHAEDN